MKLSRVIQPKGTKGSLNWIQRLVNEHPNIINQQLAQAINLNKDENINWLSPLGTDEYAEYRDASFTQRLGITLNRRSRESFWPERGPQWDALGKTDSGKVILVEAKAHLNEVVSPGTQASEISRKMIIRSLEETKVFLKVRPNIDWSGTFYQYTNRLAHLYLLRILNGIDSYLVFVYFLNDDEVEGPKLVQEWQAGIRVLEAALGLRTHELSRFILEIFIDVRELSSPVLS
ncbi:hypothetical protein ES704_04131 [subsurface metagenome]